MTAAQEQLPIPGLTPAGPSLPARWRSRAECSQVHHIERRAVLVCNWPADHEGSWHWDEGDQVMWSPGQFAEPGKAS